MDQLKNALELTERAESLPAKETEDYMMKQGLNEGDKVLETAKSCGIISEEEKKNGKRQWI